MFQNLVSTIKIESLNDAVVKIGIVFGCLFAGILTGPLHTLVVYDYDLPLAIAFWLGLYVYVPLAAFVYYLFLRIRRKLTNEAALRNSDHAFLSFFAAALYYPLYSILLAVADLHVLSQSVSILLYVPLSVFIASLLATHAAHYVLMKVYKKRVFLVSMIILATALIVLAARAQNIPPSAHDICKGIRQGQPESLLEERLKRYSRRESYSFTPEKDNYTYAEKDGTYFMLSPGRYCSVAVTQGSIRSVTEGSDSL